MINSAMTVRKILRQRKAHEQLKVTRKINRKPRVGPPPRCNPMVVVNSVVKSSQFSLINENSDKERVDAKYNG